MLLRRVLRRHLYGFSVKRRFLEGFLEGGGYRRRLEGAWKAETRPFAEYDPFACTLKINPEMILFGYHRMGISENDSKTVRLGNHAVCNGNIEGLLVHIVGRGVQLKLSGLKNANAKRRIF